MTAHSTVYSASKLAPTSQTSPKDHSHVDYVSRTPSDGHHAGHIDAPTMTTVPGALKLASHAHTTVSATDHASTPASQRADKLALVVDEKQWQQRHDSRSSPSRQYLHTPSSSMTRQTHDPEKHYSFSPRSSHPSIVYHNGHLSVTQPQDEVDSDEQLQASKSLSILLFLSGPCVALSFFNFVWTILALLVTLLYQPLRLCTPRLSSSQQICHLLTPALNLQLRAIYTQPLPQGSNDERYKYSTFWLIVVPILAPFLSIGMALAAWVVAVYWSLARVVGDPSGTDKRDDGVEVVLGLRRWWERFLLRCVQRS